MQTQLPCRLCGDVASATKRAVDVSSACEAILATLYRTLLTESVFIAVHNGVSTRIAGSPPRETLQRWESYLLQGHAEGSIGVIPQRGGPSATFLAIDGPGSSVLYLVIDADLSGSTDVLAACQAVISSAIETARLRCEARDSGRLIRRAYRAAVTIGRSKGSDSVAKAITTSIGRLLQAQRVSTWKYQPDRDRLILAAARGAAIDPETTVQPGEWVLGHVQESGRLLVVNNTGDLPGAAARPGRYSSTAYAVVPITHNRRTVGVACATHRRERSSFTNHERVALRALAPLMGAALAAAAGAEEVEQLQYAATVDPVTGLHNRAYLEKRLHEEVRRSQREQSPLSVLMIDIDDLKPINDSLGHSEGDLVLKQVGEAIRSTVRIFDVCARYGGDEFVVIMPNSDTAVAYACAQRIRDRVTDYLNSSGPVATLSIGVASAAVEDEPATLLARADRALYDAKSNGKNEVRVAGDGIDSRRRQVGPAGQPAAAPYLLVADSVNARRVIYRERADQSRLGLLIARDGEEALRVMAKFGPPALLVVDMSDRTMKGVSLLDRLAVSRANSGAIALSSSGVLRRYFHSSTQRVKMFMVRPDASFDRLRSALADGVQGWTTSLAAPADAALTSEPDASGEKDTVVTPGPDEAAMVPEKRADDERPRDPRGPRVAGLAHVQPELLERSRGEFEVARELARARREQRQLSVVLFDISSIGENPPATGPAPDIASVSDTLVRVIRASDLPIRWSDCELLLVLPGLKALDARPVAERVRAAMQAAGRHQVAVSGGVAELERDEQFGNVVDRARERVLLALNRGRNRVS